MRVLVGVAGGLAGEGAYALVVLARDAEPAAATLAAARTALGAGGTLLLATPTASINPRKGRRTARRRPERASF